MRALRADSNEASSCDAAYTVYIPKTERLNMVNLLLLGRAAGAPPPSALAHTSGGRPGGIASPSSLAASLALRRFLFVIVLVLVLVLALVLVLVRLLVLVLVLVIVIVIVLALVR